MKFLAGMLFSFLFTLAQARTWIDTFGREIEAEIVRADTVAVTLKKAGKEFKLPLAKLSDDDRKYVLEWVENDGEVEDPLEEARNADKNKTKPAPAKPSSGALEFDGKELKTGGHVNVFEFDYSAEDLAKLKSSKFKSADTGYKIGIVVPEDFDPAKPQKVFIVSTAINSEAEARSGNFSKIGMYAKTCISNGWVCISYDSNNGRSDNDFDINRSFDKFNQVWPNYKTWQFATGGFSGGAKACFDPCAFLLKNDYAVLGVFMGGCNHDNSASGKTRYKTSSSDYRKLRIFLSTGDKDNLVNAGHTATVISSLKSNGMKDIRSETFAGGHSFNREHFAQALTWMASSEK